MTHGSRRLCGSRNCCTASARHCGRSTHTSSRTGSPTTSTLCDLTPATVQTADAIVILTEHEGLDYPLIEAAPCFVLDTPAPARGRSGVHLSGVRLRRWGGLFRHRVVRASSLRIIALEPGHSRERVDLPTGRRRRQGRDQCFCGFEHPGVHRQSTSIWHIRRFATVGRRTRWARPDGGCSGSGPGTARWPLSWPLWACWPGAPTWRGWPQAPSRIWSADISRSPVPGSPGL